MLTVEDITQERVLVDRGRKADNFFTRLRGLMGVRDLPQGDGLLITPANQIHTHFMAIPIDVVYLDKEDRVMDFDERCARSALGACAAGRRRCWSCPPAPSPRMAYSAATNCAWQRPDPQSGHISSTPNTRHDRQEASPDYVATPLLFKPPRIDKAQLKN